MAPYPRMTAHIYRTEDEMAGSITQEEKSM